MLKIRHLYCYQKLENRPNFIEIVENRALLHTDSLAQPIRNQYFSERVQKSASLAQIGLSCRQPLPLTHVICLSQSESTASLAHSFSRTRPLLHTCARESDLCKRGRSHLFCSGPVSLISLPLSPLSPGRGVTVAWSERV